MKRNFSLILLFFFNYAFSQDTSWQQVRIDSFLTVSLPKKFISNDTFFVKNGRTFKTKIFKYSNDAYTLALTIIETDLDINPYEHKFLGESYAGVKYGFKKNAESQSFIVDMKDTIVNDVYGFKADVYTDIARTSLNRQCYVFCVNNLNYSIFVVPNENNKNLSTESIKKLLQSVRFNKDEILSKVPGYKASASFPGKLLVSVLLGTGIFIFFVYNDKKRKRKLQLSP